MRKTLALCASVAGSLALIAPAMTATAAPLTDTFSITSLSFDNGVAVDSDPITGDDAGFLALSGDTVLNTGDDGMAPFTGANLTAGTLFTDVGFDEGVFMFTDLSTQSAYFFSAVEGDPDLWTLSALNPLSATGVVGTSIDLSADVNLDNSSGFCTYIASGYGRVGLWNLCSGTVYDITVATGEVTELTGQGTLADYPAISPTNDWSETENGFGGAGILEYVDGTLRFVLAAVDTRNDDNTVGIYRFVPSTNVAPELVLAYPGDPGDLDLYNFTASTLTNQWCGHAEDGGAVLADDGMSEPVFCADAVFSTTAVPTTTEAAALASTGTDAGALNFGGIAAVVALGLGAVLVATRRRQAVK